jgi:hypothetical protein
VADNLPARDVTPSGPNQLRSADITDLWTDEGWLYLAIVLDLFNRGVVGWSLKPRMTADLVGDALTMGWFRRKPASGLIHHSDRGSQYASHAFQVKPAEYGIGYPSPVQVLKDWINPGQGEQQGRMNPCHWKTKNRGNLRPAFRGRLFSAAALGRPHRENRGDRLAALGDKGISAAGVVVLVGVEGALLVVEGQDARIVLRLDVGRPNGRIGGVGHGHCQNNRERDQGKFSHMVKPSSVDASVDAGHSAKRLNG